MAATFHVFVDGATDATPQGLQKLAAAIATRFGLPAPDLVNRLAKGRFRVKASADKATADRVAAELRALGARVAVEDASAAPHTGPVPKQPPPPRPAGSSLPPKTTGQVNKAAPPGSALSNVQRTGAPAHQAPTGLAAAFGGGDQGGGLGALESGALSLSSLDGADEAPPPLAASAPPPPAAAPKGHGASPPAAKALDLFAPPDMQEEAGELLVALAPEDEARHAQKRASVPPPVASPPQQQRSQALAIEAPPPRAGRMSMEPPSVSPAASTPRVPVAAGMRGGALDLPPRARLAAGVLVAILLGFVPAHFIAAARERSAFRAIDDHVTAIQTDAQSPEAYATLDSFRDSQLERKKGERREGAFIALAIWAMAGGGIAYVWFRRIPWRTA
jgi:hypothetical protein